MKTLYILTTFLLFSLLSNAQTASFLDISATAGINNTGSNHGVSVGDYDNDGWEDVYVSINNLPNKLYRNNGDNTFTDVADAAGVADEGISMCSVWFDLDNDGWLDLYVGNRNMANRLYYNNGDGTFTDISLTSGGMDAGHVRSINAADFNNDGFTDIYVANLGSQNALYLNNGNNTISNAVYLFGATDTQIAQAAIFFDYDNDRDQDLYITHDANQTFIMYENNGSGFFTNVTQQTGTGLEEQGMGVDIADIDNNGYLDIYVTNLYPNSTLLNNGDGTFTDISEDCGMGNPAMSWGTTFLDFNNDGLVDNYMVNDSYFNGSGAHNQLYMNNGDNTFQVVSDGTDLESPYGGYGSATADFNKDGKIDLFVANRGPNDGNQLFLNTEPNTTHWLQIKTVGTTSNRFGVGTRVEVYTMEGTRMIDEVNAGNGFASQSSHILHFGLNDQTIVDKVRVLWPSGIIDEYTDVNAGQLLVVTEGEAPVITSITGPSRENLLLSAVFPNPSDLSTPVLIEYQVVEPGMTTIEIFSLTGKRIDVVVSEESSIPGDRLAEWNAPYAGLFLLRIRNEGLVKTHKLLIK